MPLLNIANAFGELDQLSFPRLLSVMLFPGDPLRQEELVAVCGEMELRGGGGTHEIMARIYRRSGLMGDKRRRVDGAIAGTVLVTVRKLREAKVPEASINKAIWITEAQLKAIKRSDTKRGTQSLPAEVRANEKNIKRAWRHFRPVAHLWGALMILSQIERYGGYAPAMLSLETDPTTAVLHKPEALRLLLGVAENMRLWGEGHATRAGYTYTTLRADETWKVLSGLASLCDTLIMPPLSALEREALAGYQSPV